MDFKQTSRQWNKFFGTFIVSKGFVRNSDDSCVYKKQVNDTFYIMLLLYVDHILIASNSIQEIRKLKHQLSCEFEMKDLGTTKKILGMSRNKQQQSLFISQTDYFCKIVNRFHMENSKPVKS